MLLASVMGAGGYLDAGLEPLVPVRGEASMSAGVGGRRDYRS